MHEDNQAQRSFKKSPEETKVMKMHQKWVLLGRCFSRTWHCIGVLSMLPEPEVAIDERMHPDVVNTYSRLKRSLRWTQ
jgi:hypothetical protein